MSANLIITNVLSSSVQIQYSYLDTEELFGYKVIGTYQIDVSDIHIEQNETSLLNGREAIENAYNRQNITARIGADDYINGKITNYNFEAGTLVGSEIVSISIEENRRLDDYSSTEFAKYIPNPHAISSFSESYNFSRSGAEYTSNRKTSLTYAQEAGGQFLNNAKTFLTNYYFSNRPNFGYQEDGISENAKISDNFRGLISETYDLIGLTVSIEEKVTSSIIDDANKVSKKETQSLNIDERGFLNKTINIDLTSLRLDSQNVINLAIANIIDAKKAEEEAEFGEPFFISKALSTDGDKANIKLSFSTDPAKSQKNSIVYLGSESKDGRFINYDLSINFSSDGKNQVAKFSNARSSWGGEQGFYEDKIKRLFHPTVLFFEKSRSTNFLKTEGKIKESIKYTTDDSYQTMGDGLLKLKKTISKTNQIKRIEKFFSLQGLEDQIVQNDKKTVGQANVSAEAIVSQSVGIYKAKEILESKTEELNQLVNEDVIHITSDTITTNLGAGTASRTLNYLFIEE